MGCLEVNFKLVDTLFLAAVSNYQTHYANFQSIWFVVMVVVSKFKWHLLLQLRLGLCSDSISASGRTECC